MAKLARSKTKPIRKVLRLDELGKKSARLSIEGRLDDQKILLHPKYHLMPWISRHD